MQYEEFVKAAAEATERAARKALKRYVVASAVGYLFLLFGIGYAIYYSGHSADEARSSIVNSGRAVSVSGCNRDYDTISILRSEIAKGRKTLRQYYDEGLLTRAQYRRGIRSTRRILKRYTVPDCYAAKQVITDDPDAVIVIPEPRGDPPKDEDAAGP